eukprot:jgi/Ulvmu1/11240/UM073_0012.1
MSTLSCKVRGRNDHACHAAASKRAPPVRSVACGVKHQSHTARGAIACAAAVADDAPAEAPDGQSFHAASPTSLQKPEVRLCMLHWLHWRLLVSVTDHACLRCHSLEAALELTHIDQTPRRSFLAQVLAPAGGHEQLRAAVENGADAVYCGLTQFNARARAANFTPEELPEVVSYCHDRGVRVFVTLNVLIFEQELADAERTIHTIAAAGADAVIVQDVGIVELVRRVAPNLRIHGSTQMSITSGEGAEFARELGCARVVLGRELTVDEIAATAAKTAAEVEVFVHGALCVSYSGQCFSSEAWGGRSANRGQCAQACRLPYGLLVNGVLKELGEIKYLLSPQDLMAVELVPALMDAGVGCFKIEGRLKGPEYVALTTAAYRRAVDVVWAALRAPQPPQAEATAAPAATAVARMRGAGAELLPREAEVALRQVFARGQDDAFTGLTPGFLEGKQHQRLVRGLNPRHRGVCLGRVQRVQQGRIIVACLEDVQPGDGIVFDTGATQDTEPGGAVERAEPVAQHAAGGTLVALTVRGLNPAAVQPGQLCWRTKQEGLLAGVRGTYDRTSAAAKRRVRVDAALVGELGGPVTLTLRDADGNVACAESDMELQRATAKGLSEPQLRKALGETLGPDTALSLAAVDTSGLALEAGLFMPPSALKTLRRAAVGRLQQLRRATPSSAGLAGAPVLPALRSAVLATGCDADDAAAPSALAEPQVRVLCRSREQAAAAATLPWLDEVTLDFLSVHGLKAAVADVHAAGKRCVVALPRVAKPGEQSIWKFYLALGADALLVRSAGLLHALNVLRAEPGSDQNPAAVSLAVPPLHGDFSLNAANSLGAAALLRQGLARLTPTHDLDAAQLTELAQNLPEDSAARLEVVAHQHLPIFHTEHCVFCRFLSDGNSRDDCGHPCEENTLHLRDENGADHLVLADMGCRNTVFNAQAQSALPHLHKLVQAGYRSFRVEFVDEPGAVVPETLQLYHDVLRGERSAADTLQWLQGTPDSNGRSHGCTQGSLAVRKERGREGMKPTAAAAHP